MALKLLVLVVLVVVRSTDSAECSGKPSPDAKPNLNQIYTAAPTHVRSIANASLYTVGPPSDAIAVLHLYGGAYDRGFAHGTIMKPDVQEFYSRVWCVRESVCACRRCEVRRRADAAALQGVLRAAVPAVD